MPTRTPGLATYQTRHRQVTSHKGAVPLNGLYAVDRARRRETTGRAKPRTQQESIGLNKPDQNPFNRHGAGCCDGVACCASGACRPHAWAALVS